MKSYGTHAIGCGCTMCRRLRWRDERHALWKRAESTAGLLDAINWLDAAGIMTMSQDHHHDPEVDA